MPTIFFHFIYIYFFKYWHRLNEAYEVCQVFIRLCLELYCILNCLIECSFSKGEKWFDNLFNVKYLPLFPHFIAIYQFPKHIICLSKSQLMPLYAFFFKSLTPHPTYKLHYMLVQKIYLATLKKILDKKFKIC